MTLPQDLAAQMAGKTDHELQDMFACSADWSEQALGAARMELTKRNITVEAVPAAPKSQGLSCPKCSKTDIREPFGWRDFRISVFAALIASSAFMLLSERLSSSSLLVRLPLAIVPACLLVLACWTGLGALFDIKRCKTCGYRWSGKA
jgi:hypothetical protein